jgi:WD40-like Beta Propeller Repeat
MKQLAGIKRRNSPGLALAVSLVMLLGAASLSVSQPPGGLLEKPRARPAANSPERLTLQPFPAASGEHSYGCAAVSERQTVAVFHSSRPGGYGEADIWVSRWENNRWTEPENAGSGVNTQEHEIDPSLSPDGSMMFLSRSVFGGATAVSKLPPGADKQTDLYVSHFRDGRWTKAERIPEPVCLREAAEYRAVLARDGNRLYFGSDRAGGYGGFDLYVSHRTTTGGWGEPENLGPLVNTAGKEVDAAIAPHENTLVLAFQDEKDSFQKLYISRKINGSWSKPLDMGPRFNTGTGDGCPWLGYDGFTLVVNSRWNAILDDHRAAAAGLWVFEYSRGF